MSSEALVRAEALLAVEPGSNVKSAAWWFASARDMAREVAKLEAALAVAREREQRATDGCEKAAETFAELAEALTLLRHPTLAAACHIAEAGARAALVDEPAAAMLAEPECAVRKPDRLSGSASAAADEPALTGEGGVKESSPARRSADVTSGLERRAASLGPRTSPPAVNAAADEPGETP